MLTRGVVEPGAGASPDTLAFARRVVRDFARAAPVYLPAGLIVAAFAAGLLTSSGAVLGPFAILGLVYGGTVIAASGYVLVLWTLEKTPARIPLAILLGSAATSLVLTGGCLLTGRSAATIFVWWSVLVAAMAVRGFRDAAPVDAVNPVTLPNPVYSPNVSTPASPVGVVDVLNKAAPARSLIRVDLRDVASTAAIGLLVAVWCHRAASLLPTLRATGLAPIWSDYFIHASEIAQFGARQAMGHSSFLLVDQPLEFYHYASYMLPAAVAPLVDLPALGLATSLLLPYGVLLAALGVYAFVRTTASEAIALLAPLALLLLPDAASLGFRNGFFGFHWLLLAAPGSGYGLGIAFTALAIVAMWQAERRTSSLWLGLIVTAALFQFRAHLFVLFAPALAMTLLWETDLVSRHVRTIASWLLIGTVVGAVCIAAVPAVHQAWLQFSAFGPFMELVHTAMPPTAYDGLYQVLEQQYGRSSAWTFGFWTLVPIALGALAVALPLAWTVAIRRTGRQPLDSFPLWCAAVWLGLVLFAPPFAGDVSEFKHRPFVLVYAAFLVWTLLWLDRRIEATGPARRGLPRTLVFPALAVTALGAGVAANWGKDPARPQFAWGSQNFGTRLDRGLLEAATFVRAQAGAGDTFALIPTDPWSRLDDAATRFAALSDVPAYLARAWTQMRSGPGRRAAVEHRLAALRQIETSDDPDAVLGTLRTLDVTFLVALGDRGPLFDPEGSRAVFRTAGAAVYRAPR